MVRRRRGRGRRWCGRCLCVGRCWWRRGSCRRGDNRIDITLDYGAKSSLWWATKNEWLGLIEVAGLELEELYGGFAREPFDDDSREYFVVVRRP